MSKRATISAVIMVSVGLVGVEATAHCQIPCGIYTDSLRIQLLREHLDTVDKSMRSVQELSLEKTPNWNQLVRWVGNKDDHATLIQELVTAYFMAQRLKVPTADAEAQATYQKQLGLLHQLLVAAMKMKQGTDLEAVKTGRRLVDEFAAAYFSAEELKHLGQH